MSKSQSNKPDEKHAISDKKRSSSRSSSAIKRREARKAAGIQKRDTPRSRNALSTSGMARKPSIEKQPIISATSLIMIGVLAVVVIAAGLVVWDFSANDQGLFTSVKNWFKTEKTQSYEKLPMNPNDPPAKAPKAPNKDFAWIRGGWFWMGSNDERNPFTNPVHKVYVDGFWMNKYETTNKEWAEFVKETDYKTVAELPPNPKDFPNLDFKFVKKTKPFSLVFRPPAGRLRDLNDHKKWWTLIEGANWQHPVGPESSIDKMENYPVVHISYVDSLAFLAWKNKKHKDKKGWEYRLATEAEWEFAARGGRHMSKYTWGAELTPNGKWMANIWQGQFPRTNTKKDGYYDAAPVGAYDPNGFGLYDMAGNVWEWCHDWYQSEYYKNSPAKNPAGPPVAFDPLEPGSEKRVQRGGSFLCHASYCERYLTYQRGKGEIKSACNHIGFRYVLAPVISGR